MRLQIPIFIAGALVAFAVAAAGPGGAETAEEGSCSCAQTSCGWLLFSDSNTRTPDFWREDEIIVQEIAICRHGIQFLFVAEEDGNPYLMALMFANPVAVTRLSRRQDFTKLCGAYLALRTALRQLTDGTLEGTGRLDFRGEPWNERPRIVNPSRRLWLIWHGREIELRGYLDVYMTMLV
jgi:hypothetical protein